MQQHEHQAPQPADLDALLQSAQDGFSTPEFDSYSLRHLVQSQPAKTTHLSSLSVTPHRVLRRYAVESASGERCVMTLSFEHHGAAAAGRTAARQEGKKAMRRSSGGGGGGGGGGSWVLAGAHGEPAFPEAPLGPAPEHPPEAVVQAQLEALRDLDVFTAWRFVALRARPELGGTAERFGAALEAPQLRALLMHGGSRGVLRRQRSGGRYSEVVSVEDASGDWRQFCWSLALETEGPFEGCWMVESLRPIGFGGCQQAEQCGENEPCAVPDDF